MQVVSGSLAADAFLGNVQESVFKTGASQLEAMTYPSMISAAIGSVVVLISDDPIITLQYVSITHDTLFSTRVWTLMLMLMLMLM